MGRAEYGLTLWPEWAFAIAHLDKRVENRTWPAPREAIGSTILIHAGRSIGGRPGAPARAEGFSALRDTAELYGWHVTQRDRMCPDGSMPLRWWKIPPIETVDFDERTLRTIDPQLDKVDGQITVSAVVAVARLVGCFRGSMRRWAAEDAWGWVLEDVVTLSKPIGGVRGARGLWPVSMSLNAQIAEVLHGRD